MGEDDVSVIWHRQQGCFEFFGKEMEALGIEHTRTIKSGIFDGYFNSIALDACLE